ARQIDEVLARARALDEEAAAQRGASYAGEPDPYKKPREDDAAAEAPTEGFDVLPSTDPDA
ncbi:MAG: ribosome-binding factor, partial [Nocardioidaceae bacterium]|nr:ribosome-binding factor [Nocardioidaceae bacterium]